MSARTGPHPDTRKGLAFWNAEGGGLYTWRRQTYSIKAFKVQSQELMLMDGGDGRRALVSLRENLLFGFWFFFFHILGLFHLWQQFTQWL